MLLAGIGAAVGFVVEGRVTGGTNATAEQSVTIDRSLLAKNDISQAITDKAVVTDDNGTHLTLASNMGVGDTMVLDVPLANKSNADANAEASLDAPPGARTDIQSFWNTRTRSTTPNSRTSAPSPAPVTGVTPQTSDTIAATTSPPGVAGIHPQYATGLATSSPPGLPGSTPQTVNASATTTMPAGVQANTPQTSTAMATNTAPPGSSPVQPQNATGTATTTRPTGIATSTDRTVDFTATTTQPTGVPASTPQLSAPIATTSAPTGAPVSKSGTWYVGTFLADLDATGTLDAIHYVLTDATTAGTYDTMDLSTDNTTFGQATAGSLDNGMTGPGDDERVTATGTAVRLGPFYAFTVDWALNGHSASIAAHTWYTATVTGTDLNGDGVADDAFYAAISDPDSDGYFENLDLSIGNHRFGVGNLSDGIADYSASGNTNDERLTATSETASGNHHVRLGAYTFAFSWDTRPGGGL